MQDQGQQLRMSLDTVLGKFGGGRLSDAAVLMRTFYAGCKFILSPHNLFMGLLSMLSIFLASKKVPWPPLSLSHRLLPCIRHPGRMMFRKRRGEAERFGNKSERVSERVRK
jgi:hypothetical protein